MSFARIYMNFVNDTPSTLTFTDPSPPKHGTPPEANPPSMNPGGSQGNTSQVLASSRSSGASPGPQGDYQWQIGGTNPTQFFDVSYHHPYGNGETILTVNCPSGYQASGCNQGPSPQLTLTSTNCSGLNSHDNANCTITVTRTGT